ncbi:MAG TPA: N-acetylglucosamine-6-phosphate deacetylase [Termitinemataceae bacterium]|nr:N-acetylglucosamine-6-phosphate deacetylase [Termitinemataceae bacterium]HOM23351.1 N-acetylglucosamine-6-phosphate deacetylase [Termitinemataceae bacterium]HPQ00143.1 N-acetylglucosamine-6-phosphate deacetylase [Termitinemataceae bacterium]
MASVCLYNATVYTGFALMERCAVLIEGGVIADVFSQRRFEQRRFGQEVQLVDVAGCYIAPGFIDTHIHGFGGFGTDDMSADSVIEMSRLLAQQGVTAFNPTLYPAERPRLIEAVKEVSRAIGKESGARIMGLHLEGPFISPERLGVQRPETLSPVDLSYMEALWEASNGHIVNMTVAPELKNMRDLALYCTKKGIVLQAGHTNAQYENMVEGMQVGILHTTHLFNAMSKLDHRNPNAVGAVLIHPEMSCEIIADGVHVHPDLFKLLKRDKPSDKIVLVTDALKPTGQNPAEGPLYANGEEVTWKEGAFHRKIDDVIAGSGLTMIRGVQNLVRFGFSLEEALQAASTNPANVMRFKRLGTLVPGNEGDLVVFDKDFTIHATLVRGLFKKNNFV